GSEEDVMFDYNWVANPESRNNCGNYIYADEDNTSDNEGIVDLTLNNSDNGNNEDESDGNHEDDNDSDSLDEEERSNDGCEDSNKNNPNKVDDLDDQEDGEDTYYEDEAIEYSNLWN
ncbi:10430_t:CDS:1, partial [Cetraspora pellucida]